MIRNKLSLIAGTLLLGSSIAYGGSIVGSPHDLSAMQGTADNGEVCVYCHTPHAANTAFDGAPLWNKQATSGLTYRMYGATNAGDAGSTIGGTTFGTLPESPSLACLSCHDGISAIDSIVNAPGAGMGSLGAGTAGQNIVDALSPAYGGNIGGDFGVATSGTMVDLANDHPVSITYDSTKAGLRATTTLLNTTGSGDAWVGATDIASLLRAGMVECGSCHDPHNGTTGGDQATDTEVAFLRHSNTNSDLCVGCHNK